MLDIALAIDFKPAFMLLMWRSVGNRVGHEALLDAGRGHVPVEAAGAETDVEDNAPFAGREDRRVHFAVSQ
jgi:hypothetical protein